jgi:hypothetical protein
VADLRIDPTPTASPEPVGEPDEETRTEEQDDDGEEVVLYP